MEEGEKESLYFLEATTSPELRNPLRSFPHRTVFPSRLGRPKVFPTVDVAENVIREPHNASEFAMISLMETD